MKKAKALAYLFAINFFCTASAQTIEVTNNITTKMTKYKYMFVNYKPSVFKIEVNGKQIENGKTENIHVDNGKLEIRYDYEFDKHRKGAKVVAFNVPEDMKKISLTFNWKKKKKGRILIKGLKATSVTEIKL